MSEFFCGALGIGVGSLQARVDHVQSFRLTGRTERVTLRLWKMLQNCMKRMIKPIQTDDNGSGIELRGGGNHSGLSFDDISSTLALERAWRKFARGKHGRPDVAQFEVGLDENLAALRDELLGGTYTHGSYVPFIVHDPKRRQIHKASVRDRVVHQAVVSAVEPSFERQFIFDSYSCRVGKGTHAGVLRLQHMLRRESLNGTRGVYALKCDVRRYFASIDHEVLISLIAGRVRDEKVLWLVRDILLSHGAEVGCGIPLGNVTSQLFANIYLHELDWFAKQRLGVRYYLRYCDDVVVVSADRQYLLGLVESFSWFLGCQLKLRLHPDKTTVRTFEQGVDFLGYVVKPHAVLLRKTTRQRMLGRIAARNLSSYLGLCSHANAYRLSQAVQTVAWQGCNEVTDGVQWS